MSPNTSAPTDLFIYSDWPKNHYWLCNRMYFLMSLRDYASDLFYTGYGMELLRLKQEFPKHYRIASQAAIDNWFAENKQTFEEWLKEDACKRQNLQRG